MLFFVIILMIGGGCGRIASQARNDRATQTIDQGNYVAALIDSVYVLNSSIQLLNDSIVKLNQRAFMTTRQFVILYKYDRLLKYYRICVKNQSQWKYYKGWSIRVFQE
jgi:hypothetical protein